MESTEKLISEKLSRMSIGERPEELIKSLRGELKQRLEEVKSLLQEEMPVKEKGEILYRRLTEQVQVTRRIDIELTSTKKKLNFISREKDSLITDITNERSMKKRLEEFCRELQKQNRSMRDECDTAMAAEKAKREEHKEKLQNTLEEVTQKLEESEQEKNKLAEENEELKNKILELRDSAIGRDAEYKSVLQQKAVELHMCKAQLEHKTTISGYELTTQLELYKDRFQDFQNTLEQSNEAFGTLKKELDKLSEMIAEEEKKSAELKQECNKLDVETIELMTANEGHKEFTATLKAQQASLKAECSTLLAKK